MDKKELSKIKKGFKVENDGKLEVLSITHSYCKQHEGKAKRIFTEAKCFHALDEDVQEKYFKNSKKLLTGAFGTKLFDIEIQNTDEGNEVKEFLHEMLDNDNFEVIAEELTDNILEKVNYGSDVLVTSMLCQCYLPSSKKKSEGEGEDDNYHKFVLCSINKLDITEKELIIDNKKVSFQNSNIIVNMKKPIDGFMFPSVTDYRSDVNKILYCTGTANYINEDLTKEVLCCDKTLTAKQEKTIFETILKETVGSSISLATMSNVITKIAEEKINNEEGLITTKQLGDILEENGIPNANDALLGIVTNMDTQVKIDNIIPTGNKGVKLNNSDITISVGAGSIKKVSQSKKGGKKCLVIELSEDVNLDGFKLTE